MSAPETGGVRAATNDVPAWLGLEQDDEHRWSFVVTSSLGRGDDKLYGGTGLAVAVALQEAATGRESLWSTVQFVGSATVGDRLTCEVEELAPGRRTSQVRISVRHGGRLVLAALGSTGTHKDSPLDVQVPTMPAVPGPDEADDLAKRWGNPDSPRRGWAQIADLRIVELPDKTFAVWGRMRDEPATRASVAFMADFVPPSVVRAGGLVGAGTSLDNSIRFGRFAETEWVLVDFDPFFATGGYVHGGARMWAQDGTLLAYASQSASEVLF